METDGHISAGVLASCCHPFSTGVRDALIKAQALAPGLDRDTWPEGVHEAEALLDGAHKAAVHAVLESAGTGGTMPDVIGYHGQTLWHRPPENGKAGATLQIGRPARLAQAFQCPVVGQFRLADMAAGGHGAPLVPLYHRTLAQTVVNAGHDWPIVVINVGGVANLTWMDGERLFAFDTGPGCGLLDTWIARHTGDTHDRDARYSSAGEVHEVLIRTWLDQTFFAAKPPKSVDRFGFATPGLEDLSLCDGAATLVNFTVRALQRGYGWLPEEPSLSIVCGGGRHHPGLMAGLQGGLPGQTVTAEAMGWEGDTIEAQAFAALAVRRIKALAATEPATTGCRHALPGGMMHLPSSM